MTYVHVYITSDTQAIAHHPPTDSQPVSKQLAALLKCQQLPFQGKPCVDRVGSGGSQWKIILEAPNHSKKRNTSKKL